MKNRKIAAAAVAASLMGGMAIGSAFSPTNAAFAEDATATAKAPGQWVTDALKGLVDKGTINQEQSDAVATALKDAKPPRGGHMKGLFANDKDAEVLGMSREDLRTALQTKSLADVAKEKNVDVTSVIDAIVADQNTRLDQAVKDGRIAQAQADERKANTKERVTEMVNNVAPKGGHGPRGGRGFERPADVPAS